MDTDTREKSFYEVLGVVPEVPAGVIEKVERSVRQSGVKRRAALAACLLLTLIIPATLLVFTAKNNASAYADDGSTEELLYAFEFLNGGEDEGYLLLDVVQTDSTAIGDVRQQPPEGQLTKTSTLKGLLNEKR